MENQNLNQQPAEQPIQQTPVQPEQSSISPQQPKIDWLFLLIILSVALISYAGIAYWQDIWPFEEEMIVEMSPDPTPRSTLVGTSGWETYRSEEYGVEIKYPRDWLLYEDEQNNRITIVSTETLEFEKERIEICNDNDPTTECITEGVDFDIIFKLGSSDIAVNHGEVSFGDNLFTKYEAMSLF